MRMMMLMNGLVVMLMVNILSQPVHLMMTLILIMDSVEEFNMVLFSAIQQEQINLPLKHLRRIMMPLQHSIVHCLLQSFQISQLLVHWPIHPSLRIQDLVQVLKFVEILVNRYIIRYS